MANFVTARLSFVGGLFRAVRVWVWAVMALALAGLAALQQVRDEVPANAQENFYVRAWLPDWSWQVWAILILVILLLLVIEASYRMFRNRDEFAPPDPIKWDVIPLEPITGRSYQHETVVMDRKRFINCHFTNCVLLFKGIGPFKFDGQCKFTSPVLIETDHPAAYVFVTFQEAFRQLPGIKLSGRMVDTLGNKTPVAPPQIAAITIEAAPKAPTNG